MNHLKKFEEMRADIKSVRDKGRTIGYDDNIVVPDDFGDFGHIQKVKSKTWDDIILEFNREKINWDSKLGSPTLENFLKLNYSVPVKLKKL